MTNKQYLRRLRALERFRIFATGPEPQWDLYRARKAQEYDRLTELVGRYRNGELRAIHGQTRRHRSAVAA